MFSRRSAMLSALAACAMAPHRVWALPASATAAEGAGGPFTILRVQRRSIEVNGKPASVLGIRQPDGTPGIITEVGKQFRVRVENELDVPTLIHWHGLTPPWQEDGVPGVSGPPIQPGANAQYDFPLHFGGTYWMHSHQGLQEQRLLAAPLIIRDGRDQPGHQEVVVMLADLASPRLRRSMRGYANEAQCRQGCHLRSPRMPKVAWRRLSPRVGTRSPE